MTDSDAAQPRWSTADVVAKVDWEGGIVETIEWGLPADWIADPRLAELWGTASHIYNDQLRPVLNQIEELLPELDEGEPA